MQEENRKGPIFQGMCSLVISLITFMFTEDQQKPFLCGKKLHLLLVKCEKIYSSLLLV